MSLTLLLKTINGCTQCKQCLPFPPKPTLRIHENAQLLIIGQAPGIRVQQSGIPWNDASGNRLRTWLHLSSDQFYDTTNIAIMPMGFCYPGKGKGGDLPPRPECAPLWHQEIRAYLPKIKLSLLIGQYAQAYYLGDLRKKNLTETVKAWREYLPLGFFPLVHPSPRNQRWLKNNPWFEKEVVPELQILIRG